jgi:hypothetical protein
MCSVVAILDARGKRFTIQTISFVTTGKCAFWFHSTTKIGPLPGREPLAKKSPAERGAARNGAGFAPLESERAAAIMFQTSCRHVTVVAMEASYRIVSQADGTFAVERTEPGKEPVISGHFKTEAEARAHLADLEKVASPQDRD